MSYASYGEPGEGSAVWTAGGCESWCLNENGRNINPWLGTTVDFRGRTLRFDPARHLTHRAPTLIRHPVSAGSRPSRSPQLTVAHFGGHDRRSHPVRRGGMVAAALCCRIPVHGPGVNRCQRFGRSGQEAVAVERLRP
jgi:hypothetical protein